jgi:DNA-directed RNA polymerase subunit RPC12/RpoP
VTHKGYCMKCKTKVDAVTERVDDNPNGSMHARGKCSTCGTGVHSFHSAADGQKLRDALESNRALTGGTG